MDIGGQDRTVYLAYGFSYITFMQKHVITTLRHLLLESDSKLRKAQRAWEQDPTNLVTKAAYIKEALRRGQAWVTTTGDWKRVVTGPQDMSMWKGTVLHVNTVQGPSAVSLDYVIKITDKRPW